MSILSPLVLKPEVSDHLQQSLFSGSEEDVSAQFHHLLGRLGTPPLYTTLRINPNAGKSPEELLHTAHAEITKNYKIKGWKAPRIYLHAIIKDLIVVEGRGPNVSLQQHEKRTVVDLACGMAVLRGADVFAQGIMCCSLGLSEGDPVSVYSDITGTLLKGATKFDNGTLLHVGNGIARVSRERLFSSKEKATGVGISMTEPLYEAPCLTDLCLDLVFPQNLPSVVVGLALDPRQGETILDMCASPGGKTVHIATLMKEKGRLIALDKTPAKIAKIKKNAENWNITFIETYAFDSRNACVDSADPCGEPPYPPGMFDRVLLDGPCSALGQRPSSRNWMSLKSLQSYPCLQKALFREAVRLLKPGGTLVYGTCTITLAENEEVVVWALKSFPSLSLAPMEPHIGGKGRACDGLSQVDRDKLQLFYPGHTDLPDTDTIGFFIARFLKTSS